MTENAGGFSLVFHGELMNVRCGGDPKKSNLPAKVLSHVQIWWLRMICESCISTLPDPRELFGGSGCQRRHTLSVALVEVIDVLWLGHHQLSCSASADDKRLVSGKRLALIGHLLANEHFLAGSSHLLGEVDREIGYSLT